MAPHGRDDEDEGAKKEITLLKNPKQWLTNAAKSGGRFIWNGKKKTFINRSFLSWGTQNFK
jgi:hypothetical protein